MVALSGGATMSGGDDVRGHGGYGVPATPLANKCAHRHLGGMGNIPEWRGTLEDGQ